MTPEFFRTRKIPEVLCCVVRGGTRCTMQFSIFDDQDAIPVSPETDAADYRTERNIARAAEYLVAYDISRRGWDCFTVGESLRYDLIADVHGLRRIQVKMNRRAVFRAPGSVSLSYTFGRGDNKPMHEYAGAVDLLALVGMDRSTVLYVLPSQVRVASLHITASTMTPEMSDLSWAQAMRSWGLE